MIYCSFALKTLIWGNDTLMAVFSENSAGAQNDFELGIDGFRFSDLFDAVRLNDLAASFYAEVGEHDAVLHIAKRFKCKRRGRKQKQNKYWPDYTEE